MPTPIQYNSLRIPHLLAPIHKLHNLHRPRGGETSRATACYNQDFCFWAAPAKAAAAFAEGGGNAVAPVEGCVCCGLVILVETGAIVEEKRARRERRCNVQREARKSPNG